MRADNSFIHTARHAEIIGVQDECLHCERKDSCAGRNSITATAKDVCVSAETTCDSRGNLRTILRRCRSELREFSVKVFNSSVENRVEKPLVQFKNTPYIYVSSSLHKFRCRCASSKQKSKQIYFSAGVLLVDFLSKEEKIA